MTKPKVLIFATGGSIFSSTESEAEMLSYSTEGLTLDEVISQAPSITNFADVETSTFCNVPSSSITTNILVGLARTVEEASRRKDVTGIVITHGTDTMEETAFFLNLVLKTSKPIVLTGGMRPASAISADGPINLLNAVKVASNPEAKGKGVLIVMNGVINGARDTTMTNTTSLDTFKAREFGMFGSVLGDEVQFFSESSRPHTLRSQFSLRDFDTNAQLPRVVILTGHIDDDGYLVELCAKAGVAGIVYAGCGHGTIPLQMEDVLKKAVNDGCVVVRTSRVGSGCVFDGVQRWQDSGFIPAGSLSPQKARILLQLAIHRFGNDPTTIRAIFKTY